MQINNTPVFFPATTAGVNDKQVAAKLPVVYQPQSVSEPSAPARTTIDTTVVNAISDESSARQARFIRAFASTAATGSAPAETNLPPAVQQYIQVAGITSQSNDSGRIVDETV